MNLPAENHRAHTAHDVALTPELTREILVQTAAAPGADHRVLTYVLTSAPLGNTLREPLSKVAAEIGISAPSVGKSVSRLVEGGWLELSHKVGRVAFYRAGPRVFQASQKIQPTPTATETLATVTPLRPQPDDS